MVGHGHNRVTMLMMFIFPTLWDKQRFNPPAVLPRTTEAHHDLDDSWAG